MPYFYEYFSILNITFTTLKPHSRGRMCFQVKIVVRNTLTAHIWYIFAHSLCILSASACLNLTWEVTMMRLMTRISIVSPLASGFRFCTPSCCSRILSRWSDQVECEFIYLERVLPSLTMARRPKRRSSLNTRNKCRSSLGEPHCISETSSSLV